MDTGSFTAIVALGSIIAGFFGALTGLGGGILIVPLLTLVFGVDIHYAIGASLVSIIATSSGAAATFIKQGYTNFRIAMFLEIATTIGAIIGAYIALDTPTQIISIIFGAIIILTTLSSLFRSQTYYHVVQDDPLAMKLKMNSNYQEEGKSIPYKVTGVKTGFGIMFLAGSLSGLLGIGSGALKVLALDTVMRLPFRVSTATSNLMIGVTAAASAALYLTRGYINPTIAMPVMLGVLLGSTIGALSMRKIKTKNLRRLFSLVVFVIAIQMIIHGIQNYGQ